MENIGEFSEEQRQYINGLVERINYQDHVISQTLKALRGENHRGLFWRLAYAFRPVMFPNYKRLTLIRLHGGDAIPRSNATSDVPDMFHGNTDRMIDTPPMFRSMFRKEA